MKSERTIWDGMKQRCYNPKRQHYKYYGARGITVCERWRSSFKHFYEDMGPRPSIKHSLDRIDNNGNYEPKNCRWATWDIQAGNRRGCVPSKKVKVYGKLYTLRELSRHTGIPASELDIPPRERLKLIKKKLLPSKYKL